MAQIQVAPSASVYALVHSENHHQKMLNNVGMMNLISREIENAVLKDRAPARIFSSFQRISSFMPQAQRYQRLAEYAESVHVFAHFDRTPPPILNVNFVPLKPTDQLAKEWFIIADAPQFFTALVTEEIDSVDDPRAQRMFRGFWSFDEELVTIIQDWLSNLVHLSTRPHVDNRHQSDYKGHISLMGGIVSRITEELAVLRGR